MEIKYYPNPLDNEEYLNGEGETILEVLQSLEIQDKPLCVIINGECPDDIDLNYKIKESDIVEIRNIVEGGAGDWATIVDVLTVVAIVALAGTLGPVGLAAIALGGSLISGAIRKGIKPPKLKDMTPEERSVGTNDLSLTQAQNQARQLQPIPIPIGDIQFAPDMYSYPYIERPITDDIIIVNPTEMIVSTLKSEINTTYSAQVFSYGFGDFEVYKRSIGAFEMTDTNRDTVGYSTINFRHQFEDPFRIPYSSPNWERIWYHQSVNPKTGSSFTNTIDYDRYVPTDDDQERSWSYFEGQKGQSVFAFGLSGSLYSLVDGSYSMNRTYCQVQVKTSKETEWTNGYLPGYVYFLENMTADNAYFRIGVSRSLSDGGVLQVRVRKAQNDEIDNTTSKVARLNIVNPYFYVNLDNTASFRLPINMDGVYLTNTMSPDSTTNNYVVSLRAKCWVYTDGSWVWTHTRNPAWWYVYFAHGGFLNLTSSADGQQYPYSPTNCWQNYPGLTTNQELMWGGGYSNDQIDMEKIKEWAIFCDRENLKIDTVLRDDVSVSEVLDKIANVGRGSIDYSNGMLSVVYEDKNQIPVTMFGMSNIEAGSFSVNYNVSGLPTKVRASFSNREEEFELDTVESEVPYSDQSKLKVIEVTLTGVTDPAQAERECNLLAARQFFQTRNYTWKTDHEGFIAKRGDLVYLSHDSAQYGYSGRIHRFIIKGSTVVGFETTANLNDVSWVMIRLPNGEMKKFRCKLSDKKVIFVDDFPLTDAPFQIKDKRRGSVNESSRFRNSIAEDYIFIADIKETPGKIVRISAVESAEDNKFTYSAVDEDPALWAYEMGIEEDPQSIDDAIGKIEVFDVSAIDNKDGTSTITWNATDDSLFMLIDVETNSPILINGMFSIGSKEVTIELTRERQHIIKIVPVSIYEKVTSITKTVQFWQS